MSLTALSRINPPENRQYWGSQGQILNPDKTWRNWACVSYKRSKSKPLQA